MAFTTLPEWLAWQQTLHPSAIDLGLDRIRRTLERLGWRQPSCPVITIAGTNGKGSTVAFPSRILRAAGYRGRASPSPHVRRYNERIVIAGSEASDASLIAAFERIDAARGADTLTFFEFNTIAALLIFETAGLDVIVLETGMGGRLDAVNVVDADVAIVTSIALDHCEWLGNDVESIGREKAGIFRSGRPAVFGSTDMPASIQSSADAVGASLLRLGREYRYARGEGFWSWHGTRSALEHLPNPALAGDVQFDNASTVLTAIEAMAERLPVSRAAIEEGLRSVRITARFQRIAGRNPWILDVAHNPAAARTLASQLAAYEHRGRLIAVCGMLGDKDIEGVARELRDAFDLWIVAGLSGDRTVPPETTARRLSAGGVTVTEVAADVGAACSKAASIASDADTVVVFGSFLTIAAAIEWLERSRIIGSHS